MPPVSPGQFAAPRPRPPDDAGAGRRRTGLVAVALFAGTLALFSRTLGYRFTNYDDPIYVTGNLHVQGGLSWEGVRWAFAGSRIDFWQPLTWLSHMADVELFGPRPWGHHLTSILWHGANAVLVLLVLRRLTGAFWTSALAAALFAWHPLRVESVTWITERKDVMSGCFFLLTLWAYVVYAERRAAGRPARSRYALALAAYVGALMCKPVVVVLPVLLLLLDVWPLRRLPVPGAGESTPAAGSAPDGAARAGPGRVLGALLLEKAPFFALAAGGGILTLLFQAEGSAYTAQIPAPARVANALVSIPRYLGRFFWPSGLAVLYPHPGAWPAGATIAAAVLILVITGAAVRWFRPAPSGQPWLLIGWGWFLVMLLPNIGLIQVGYQALADRYTYLPMLGVVLALLWTVRTVLPQRTPAWVTAGAAALVLAGCGARTWGQQATWRDPLTLFTHALAVTRDNYPAHTFLSYTLLTEGRVAEAEAQARRALEINPRFATGYEALALVHIARGRPEEAVAAYRQELKLNPGSAAAHREFADLLLQLGRLAEADSQVREALRINPRVALAYTTLARVELAGGRPGSDVSAVSAYTRALRLEPRDWMLHGELAGLLASLGRTAESREHFETSLRLAPRNLPVRLAYARMLGDAGQTAEALAQVRQAAALQPDDPAVQAGLAHALEQTGRLDEASSAYAAVLRRQPDDADALCGLGRILLERGQPDAAAASLEQALRANPADVTALVLLGDARARQGNLADAAARYEQALRLQPRDGSVEARLGFALLLLRRPDEAIEHWELALRLDPKIPGLRERIEQVRRQAGAGARP